MSPTGCQLPDDEADEGEELGHVEELEEQIEEAEGQIYQTNVCALYKHLKRKKDKEEETKGTWRLVAEMVILWWNLYMKTMKKATYRRRPQETTAELLKVRAKQVYA